MRQTLCHVALALCLCATPAFGQEDGTFAGGRAGSGLPTDINLPRTIPQQFSIKLKLDRTQQPDVDRILTAAAAEAAPSAQEMLQIRQRLLNAILTSHADEVTAAEEAYAQAAAKGAKVEADAFGKVYLLLKPNQQKEAPAAFALIAGLFANPRGPGVAGPGGAGGRSGGRGGGRGEAFPFSRFELLVQYFQLEGERKKTVKAAVDEAHKAAAGARAGLLRTHAELGAAQVAADPASIDRAASAYGTQAGAMARIEMELLSRVIGIGDPERQNRAGVQAAFYLVRGMFLGGKWDEIPNPDRPSY